MVSAADERSVELRAGGSGGAQPTRLIVAVMRGLKVTETRKSSGGLAAELAAPFYAELRPHRQPPISGSGQENRGFRTARTECEAAKRCLAKLQRSRARSRRNPCWEVSPAVAPQQHVRCSMMSAPVRRCQRVQPAGSKSSAGEGEGKDTKETRSLEAQAGGGR